MSINKRPYEPVASANLTIQQKMKPGISLNLLNSVSHSAKRAEVIIAHMSKNAIHQLGGMA